LKGYDLIVVTVHDGNNQIAGSVICIVHRLLYGLRFPFTSRAIVIGGPVVRDSEENKHAVFELLVSSMVVEAEKKSVYLEFRNSFDLSAYMDIFKKYKLDFNDHLNFLINTGDPDTVQKRMSKTKLQQVRKSFNAGAEICIAQSLDELKEFYVILTDLYKNKVRKPLPDFSFFETFFREGKKVGFYLLAKYEGKVIGGMMCPVFRDQIMYDWYVCGRDRIFKDIYPSTLVTWAAIDYAMKHRIPLYDFLGAGKPKQEYGVRDFKAQFGGDLVNYGRMTLTYNQKKYNLSQQLLKKIGYFK
jgi:lipid II:glycine glycyltransferase (peptidoglycan interpeptide bridge formation enzyme)